MYAVLKVALSWLFIMMYNKHYVVAELAEGTCPLLSIRQRKQGPEGHTVPLRHHFPTLLKAIWCLAVVLLIFSRGNICISFNPYQEEHTVTCTCVTMICTQAFRQGNETEYAENGVKKKTYATFNLQKV